MIKKILLLLLLIHFLETKAQQTIATPSSKDWETYLLKRIDGIQQQLYKLALELKIKAYKNDSLTSFYTLKDLKLRGSESIALFIQTDPKDADIGYDSIGIIPFNPKELKGLCFVSQYLSSPFETEENSNLKAIGILFQPTIGGMLFNKMPIALFNPNDVQNVLSAQDFEFLKLYYYFCKHGEGKQKYYENYNKIWGDHFYALSYLKTQNYIGDSLQNKLIYSMLSDNDFFKEIWNNNSNKILFDEQEKTKLSFFEFEINYGQTTTLFLNTDPDDPTIGKDTVVSYPVMLVMPQQIIFNKDNSLNQLKFTFKKEEIKGLKSQKLKNEYSFTISKKDLIDSGFQPAMIWFYEDYMTYLKRQKK